MSTSRAARRVVAATAGVLSVVMFASSSSASPTCRSVDGRYREHDTSGAGCASPVGLCIAGDYQGDITGSFAGLATSITPTADTPASGVVLFTSDSSIDARIGKRSGTLTIKNAGAFRTVGEGSIVDVQTIVGGTGDFAGASGALRAEGTFTAGAGESRYRGTVCTA
jgi:hypothetical protein